MNHIKLFSKNQKELETLLQKIRIQSQGIEIEFGIEKCAMHSINCEKRELAGGIDQ